MLTRWGDFDASFAAFDLFRRRMNRLFDDYNYIEEQAFSSSTAPQILVRDDGDRLLLRAELPGIPEDGIKLNLDKNVLTLAATRKVSAPEGYDAHRRERPSMEYTRSFSLPCDIDPELAKATVKDGVLTVTLEKAKAAQPRQIAVTAS